MIRLPLKFNKILNGSRFNTFGWVRSDRKTGEPNKRFHQGWDLVAPKGTPVYPVSEGEIVYAQPYDDGKSHYGISLLLKFKHSGKTYYAFYAHLQSISIGKGDFIDDVEIPIGKVGDTGNAKGIREQSVHLHFEIRNIRRAPRGTAGRIDPASLYGLVPYAGASYYSFEDEIITPE